MRARATLGLLLAAACAAPGGSGPARPEGRVRYAGSSTVAGFLRDAAPVYGALDLVLDTTPESAGAAEAVLSGRAELGGIATRPRPETLRAGVIATLIGRDAIAVVVNAQNPVAGLTREQLRDVFRGRVERWSELGGPDVPVEAFVVAPESATRAVVRERVLQGAPFEGCREVRPDTALIERVAATLGGIGAISFSFLQGKQGVRALAVDGERPAVTNFDYPIYRPLYLLWREGEAAVEAFVHWTQGPEGQRVLMGRFVGRRVLGAARVSEPPVEKGTLVVYTPTYAYYDGGLYYYPHLPYEVLTLDGRLLRRVPNHRGENDEAPTPIHLAPGTYLVRITPEDGEAAEFLVTLEAGRLTELEAAPLMEERP